MLALALPAGAATEALGGRVQVQVAPVTSAAVSRQRTSTGTVHAWRRSTVSAEVSGHVVDRMAEPGVRPAAGDALVRIDSGRADVRLRRAESTALARRADAEHATHEHQRALRLFDQNAISQDTVDDARFAERRAAAELEAALAAVDDARRDVEDSTVRAPFGGKVEWVHVHVGDYVTIGTPIATLTDFSSARLVAGVSASDVDRVHESDPASIAFPDLGGLVMEATVTSVGSIRDEATGTFPVELRMNGPSAPRLREGMIGTVTWGAPSIAAIPPTVPVQAVVRRGGRLVAWVVDGGVARERPIRTGRTDGARIEISEGLREGERVVTSGHFALRDGMTVEITGARAP